MAARAWLEMPTRRATIVMNFMLLVVGVVVVESRSGVNFVFKALERWKQLLAWSALTLDACRKVLQDACASIIKS